MTNHTIHNKLNKTTIILESNGENNNSFKKVILVIVIILSTMVLFSIIIFFYIYINYRKNIKIKNEIEINNENLNKLTDSSCKSYSNDMITNKNSLVEINCRSNSDTSPSEIYRNAITIHDIELSEIYKKDHNKRLVFNPLNST
jgi:hypothetical protein